MSANCFSAPALLTLRRDPRLLKLPPFLSLLLIIAALAWLLILPIHDQSRNTYISENALLPGQAHTYFGGSEHTIFRAYRHEVSQLGEESNDQWADKIEHMFREMRLKTGSQRYNYEAAGRKIQGKTVYGVLQAPRGDATEAIVLVGAWRNMDDVLNQSGVALVLTMARYFKRWSVWSKDVIFVVTPDSTAGPQAWADAYHDMHDRSKVDDLPIKSGALQGAIALDYPAGPGGHRFDKLHILYEGTNGQQPNLDLFNTVVQIATGHMGITCTIQRMWQHAGNYMDRLSTLLRGIFNQGLGHATGPHSSFIPYHVDAITLVTVGDGWHDEMSLGKVVESSFRSLNNLLEHLHQSFFFYMLLEARRFVSIGTYLPSAMLLAANFTITAIFLWIQSGRADPTPRPAADEINEKRRRDEKMNVVKEGEMVALVPKEMLETAERRLLRPVVFVVASHLIGLLPFYILNQTTESMLSIVWFVVSTFLCLLPIPVAFVLSRVPFHRQEIAIMSCFSLLLLGIALSALSTINFSLGLMTGLAAAPVSFVRPHYQKPILAGLVSIALLIVAPPTVVEAASAGYMGSWDLLGSMKGVLVEASIAWKVSGTWTAVILWVVWWPAWFVAETVAFFGLFAPSPAKVNAAK